MVGGSLHRGPTATRMGLIFFLIVCISMKVRATGTTGTDNTRKISAALKNKFTAEHVSKENPVFAAVIVSLRDDAEATQGKSVFGVHPEVKSIFHELHSKAHDPEERHSDRVTELMHSLQVEMTKEMDPVLTVLHERGLPYESLWASKEVYIPRASWGDIQKIAEIPAVKSVRSPAIFSLTPPAVSTKERPAPTPNSPTSWNLVLSKARCLDITCLGEGVTVGFIDSGARVTHQEIKKNWIGMPFGFFDGASPTGNCTPRDDDGYGTLSVGIAVGATVGAAPKASWMMCRGCTSGNCSEASVKLCGQYLACPWKCDDTTVNKVTKNCAKRPDIIANGWYLLPSDLLDSSYDFYYPLVELWNSLGIISPFPVGDTGPTCNTVNPPATYDISLGVGAVDETATVTWYSSLGPELSKRPLTKSTTAAGTCEKNTCGLDHSTKTVCSLVKPDITAPGDNVNSSDSSSDSSYSLISGTSTATAQVAGVVALMKCASPRLSWNYKLAHKLLTSTAATDKIDLLGSSLPPDNYWSKDANAMCNCVLSDNCNLHYPNNVYGYGLVNACKAVKATKMEKGHRHHDYPETANYCGET